MHNIFLFTKTFFIFTLWRTGSYVPPTQRGGSIEIKLKKIKFLGSNHTWDNCVISELLFKFRCSSCPILRILKEARDAGCIPSVGVVLKCVTNQK